MIDIIGYLKVDESKPERIKYLQACIRSYSYIPDANMIIGLEDPSESLFKLISEEVEKLGLRKWGVYKIQRYLSYGETYIGLINHHGSYEYILNLMEDHFCVLNNPDILLDYLHAMDHHGVGILKSSFFTVEQNSATTLRCIEDSRTGKIFVNDESNFTEYQKHYGTRFYIGVNAIMSREFAKRIWVRTSGYRPHEYEISGYDKNLLHVCMIPGNELQAAIDDDHGEPDSCLLKRKELKFNNVITALNDQAFQPA